MPTSPDITVTAATEADASLILSFIRGLAEYEKLLHACVATEADLRRTLFGPRSYAEVLIARYRDEPAGFALFFHNYSTFLAKPGIYLEDLFVLPSHRRHGIGKALLVVLARLARDRGCGRLEWSVLDWNAPSIAFYKSLGAVPMDEWTVFRMTEDTIAELAEEDSGPRMNTKKHE
jgi:GNAT superfamily N-acetyltransferase